jgi:hypothetical protein
MIEEVTGTPAASTNQFMKENSKRNSKWGGWKMGRTLTALAAKSQAKVWYVNARWDKIRQEVQRSTRMLIASMDKSWVKRYKSEGNGKGLPRWNIQCWMAWWHGWVVGGRVRGRSLKRKEKREKRKEKREKRKEKREKRKEWVHTKGKRKNTLQKVLASNEALGDFL